MQILRDYRGLAASHRGGVGAIGNFDGIHRGHATVITKARELAQADRVPLSVVTFEPHPRRFFQPDAAPFRLTQLSGKVRILRTFGVERLYALRFDAEFAALSAEEFVTRVLVEGLALNHVVVGADFQFGKNRLGTVTRLVELGRTTDLAVTSVAPQAQGGIVFSSSAIRGLLQAGKPREAADLLGRFWSIEGQVVQGDRRGRTIGFPTANVALGEYLHPAPGVYAVRVDLQDGRGPYNGVANFGRRPTFDKADLLLEVHLFDFAGDLYGRPVEITFVEFIRPEQKFEAIEALKRQITADAVRARAILADPANASPLAASF